MASDDHEFDRADVLVNGRLISGQRLFGMALRHARTLNACIHSPADLWLAARMTAWAAVLPALKYTIPLPRLVELVRATPRHASREREVECRIVTLAFWLHAPLAMLDRGCMQRSLLTYRFLGAAGAQPHLSIGVRKEGTSVQAHAWVFVDGAPAGESVSEIAPYVPILLFGPDGRKEQFAR